MNGSTARGATIAARGIRKKYGATCVLNGVDMEVAQGEFVSLLGPSGSGKTTFLMVLAGFVLPDSGSLFFADESVLGKPPHRRNLGMVFQSHALFPHLSVFENVAFPLRVRRMKDADIRRKVRDALALVRMEGFEERRIGQLSGGQSQRVALARAIVFEPRILLMDEPLSALDKQLREHMQVEIRLLHEQIGLTTVYVTHDQREAFTMSDRVAVLDRGRVAQIASPQELYDRPASAFVAGFVGESSFVPVRTEGKMAYVGDKALRSCQPPPAQGRLLLMMRPERLALGPVAEGDETVNVFPGTVQHALFQGDSILIRVRLDLGEEVLVRETPGMGKPFHGVAAGERVGVRLHRDDVVLVAAD